MRDYVVFPGPVACLHKPEGCKGQPDMFAVAIVGGGGMGANHNSNPKMLAPSSSRNPFVASTSLMQPFVRVLRPVVFVQLAATLVVPPLTTTELPPITGKKRDASVLVGLDFGKRPKAHWSL